MICGVNDSRLSRAQVQPVILKLAADLLQQVVTNVARHQRIAQAAMGRFIRHGSVQLQPADQCEIQLNLQGALKLCITYSGYMI